MDERALRKALTEAYDLLDHARAEMIDPGLRRAWARRRRALMDRIIEWGLAK